MHTVKGASKALVFAAVMVALLVSGCQSDGADSVVGRWRDWGGLFCMEFTVDGEVIYDIEDTPEYIPHIVRGTYQITSGDKLLIDIAHEQCGEYIFKVEGDVLQLTDASGERMVYHRMKVSAE